MIDCPRTGQVCGLQIAGESQEGLECGGSAVNDARGCPGSLRLDGSRTPWPGPSSSRRRAEPEPVPYPRASTPAPAVPAARSGLLPADVPVDNSAGPESSPAGQDPAPRQRELPAQRTRESTRHGSFG